MLHAFGGPQLGAQLSALRAGAAGLLSSGVLGHAAHAAAAVAAGAHRSFAAAALSEPTALPKPGTQHFHYAVLQAPLMQVRGIREAESTCSFVMAPPATRHLPSSPRPLGCPAAG